MLLTQGYIQQSIDVKNKSLNISCSGGGIISGGGGGGGDLIREFNLLLRCEDLNPSGQGSTRLYRGYIAGGYS